MKTLKCENCFAELPKPSGTFGGRFVKQGKTYELTCEYCDTTTVWTAPSKNKTKVTGTGNVVVGNAEDVTVTGDDNTVVSDKNNVAVVRNGAVVVGGTVHGNIVTGNVVIKH